MPIKVYKNKFEYVHENVFFRSLALELMKKYEHSDESVVLIGNPVITDEDGNKVAPDALFISNKSFVIIDFKNFEGDITLPDSSNFEIESWKHSNVIVKGGNQINPYIQLKNHKRKIADYLNYHKSSFLSQFSKFNMKYIDCVVCFINEVNVIGDIPEFDRNWFFVKDKNSITGVLEDITTTTIKLNTDDLNRLAHLFSTTHWNPDEAISADTEINQKSVEQQYHLTTEQNKIFDEIESFLKDESQSIFLLSGSYSSGKTFLINHLINNIPKDTINGWQVLAPNNRIARNVRKQIESVNSLYSYVFKFSEQIEVLITDDNKENNEEKEIDEEELIDTKLLFNIRENNDSEKFLYIVDEAHHVSDAKFISPTIQFGTGQLLTDLISYINANETNRKVIFIGDKYRLGIGNYEESALCAEYLDTQFSLKTKEVELLPYPKTNNNILKQANSVRNQIATDQYNQLNLIDSDIVKVAQSNTNLKLAMQKHFQEEIYNTKILAFSNDNIADSNNWVRANVMKRQTDIEKGDIVIINNNVIVAPDNPFAVPQKIFKGEFAEILSVGQEIITINQPFKGKKPVQLNFKEFKLKLVERNLEVNVLSFENYWHSIANDITREEYIALQTYINQKVTKQIKEEKQTSEEWLEFIESEQYKVLESEIATLQAQVNKGRPVKTKLKESQQALRKVENKFWKNRRLELHRDIVYHDKYANAVHIRFGYALTVHKAQSYKWNHVFFNLNQGDDRGTDNKQYFKWAYSGIGCAKKRLYLVNTPKITPYIKMVWKDNHACVVESEKKSEFFPYNSNTPIEPTVDKPSFYNDCEEFLYGFYCWLSSELSSIGISIKGATHNDYTEIYEFTGQNNEVAKVLIWYDGKKRFKKFKIATSSAKEFEQKIDEFLTSLKDGSSPIIPATDSKIFSSQITTELFEKLNEGLESKSISIISVENKNYSDRVTFSNTLGVLVLDVFLNSEGFISSIYPIKCNNPALYDDVKLIFTDFIEKHGKPLRESE